jgi:DNA-binding transcriptional LysR family regulator
LAQILRQQWLMVPSAKSEIRVRFDLLCEKLGIEPRIRAEVDDMATLRLLARDAGAVALIPAIVVKDELGKGLLEKYGSVQGWKKPSTPSPCGAALKRRTSRSCSSCLPCPPDVWHLQPVMAV